MVEESVQEKSEFLVMGRVQKIVLEGRIDKVGGECREGQGEERGEDG